MMLILTPKQVRKNTLKWQIFKFSNNWKVRVEYKSPIKQFNSHGLENGAERKKRIAYFYPQRSTNFVAFDEDNDAIGT